jgi:hypothetical protein
MRRCSLGILTLLILCVTTTTASGQVSVGASYIFAAETSFADEPGTLSPPPEGGLVPRGLVVFVGAGISRHVGIQSELSMSDWTSTTRTSSYQFGSLTDTTRHRDVLVSGLLRLGPQRSCCNVMIGGGLVFARTYGTSAVVYRDPQLGPAPDLRARNPMSPRLALTIGGDFPIPIHRHLSILPTARLHWMSRHTLSPGADPDVPVTGRPGNFAFRGGVGARVDF